MDDIKQAITNTVENLATDIYTDLAKPSIQVLGETAGRTTKALLAPLRGMLWSWETFEDWLYESVNQRVKDIPEENRQSPRPEVAVPLIEAMRYSANNETLRDMYTKLLTNSMDNRKNKEVHPSYVDIIKQMDTLDAILFSKIQQDDYIRAINPHIGGGKNLQEQYYANSLPEWYIGVHIDGYDMFEISASLLRLARLGLIDLMYDRTAGKVKGDHLILTEEIQNRLSIYRVKTNDSSLEVIKTDSIVNINDFGKVFAKICL